MNRAFCEKHLDRLLGMSNKLSYALMLQTHLAEFTKKLYRDSIPLLKNTPDPKKQLAVLEKKRKSCYVCARKREFMSATYSAFAYMYRTDAEFDGRMREQPYFCLRHMHCLLEAAGRGAVEGGIPRLLQDAERYKRRVLTGAVGGFGLVLQKIRLPV